MFYRWFLLIKKLILWPFKLGVFSFLFSILGFDVKWFLGIFDFFSFNIPNWIYTQYFSLYCNWLNWWHNTVKIKNLNNVSLNEKPEIESKATEISDPENKSNKKKILIFLGLVILLGVVYFFYFGDTSTGSGGGTNNLDNPHQIDVNNNQNSNTSTRSRFRTESQLKLKKAVLRSLRAREVTDRSNVMATILDQVTDSTDSAQTELIRSEGPPSPTGSDDSNETVKASSQASSSSSIKDKQLDIFLNSQNKK